MIKVAPSLLSADLGALAAEIKRMEEAGADWIHVDVMDGSFVPNITMGPVVLEAVRRSTSLPVDVHLMVREPEHLLEAFQAAGADLLTVQAEACRHLHRVIQKIGDLGMKAGVALNPATPPACLRYLLDEISLVLVMSVNPGFAGQRFIPAVLAKIREVRRILAAAPRPVELQVDGGINRETAPQAVAAGATVLVAGTAIFQADDAGEVIEAFKRLSLPDYPV